jgi:hypothetical protein
MNRLVGAIDRLIAFFDGVQLPGEEERSWAGPLKDIRDRLLEPSSRGEALRSLEGCFGGMGSLNDYLFHPQNRNVPPGEDDRQLNRELDGLRDRCYMEYRLLGQPWYARAYWRWLALRHRGAPPPRVLNAFARKKR